MDSLKQMHIDLLMAGVEGMREDEDMSDVDLLVNQRVFKCHKAILASISPYFKAMFTGGMMESSQKQITIKDIDTGPFDKFLQFVYTGNIDLSEDDVLITDMLRLAALFQVDCLQDYCEDVLLEQFRSDSALEMYRLSCIYNCIALKRRSWQAILDGFSSLWQTENFDKLTLDEVVSIIEEDRLVAMDEEHVCEAVVKWVKADSGQRQQHCYRLLCHVRLPHLSPEYIVNTVCQETCLMEDVQCKRLVNEAMHYHLLPARKLDHSNPRMKYRLDDDLEEVLLVITENGDERGSFYEGGCCLWAFSFHQRRWFTLAPIPVADGPGADFGICSHGFDIYVSGGLCNPKSLLKFESDRNEWVLSQGQMKKGRSKHSMVAAGNSLFALGGLFVRPQRERLVIGSIEEYHITARRWTLIGELPYAVHSASAAVCGEQVLIFGGIGKDDVHIGCVQYFHTRTKESCVISNLPLVEGQLIATTVGEKTYVTSLDKEGGADSVFKMNSDFGFIDATFEMPPEKGILDISHHDQHLLILTSIPSERGNFGKIVKLNMKTSKWEVLEAKGSCSPYSILACHRSYVDKRFLYHTYFQ